MTSANSLTRLGREATAIGGPLIAATLIAVGGTPPAFGLDALSFFVSAAAIRAIFPTRRLISRPRSDEGALAALREGIAAVIRMPCCG